MEERLIKSYDGFINLKDPQDFFVGLCEYLAFIADNPTLNRRVVKNFSTPHSTSSNYAIGKLYKTLVKLWAEHKNAEQLVWNDLNKKSVGMGGEYEVPVAFMDISMTRPFMRFFHESLVTAISTQEISGKISILIRNIDQEICSGLHKDRCYSIRKSSKSGKRFETIKNLYRAKGGMSTDRLAKLIGREDLSNMRREIDEINTQFKNKVSNAGDLIVVTKRGQKNIFALNSKIYNFTLEE